MHPGDIDTHRQPAMRYTFPCMKKGTACKAACLTHTPNQPSARPSLLCRRSYVTGIFTSLGYVSEADAVYTKQKLICPRSRPALLLFSLCVGVQNPIFRWIGDKSPNCRVFTSIQDGFSVPEKFKALTMFLKASDTINLMLYFWKYDWILLTLCKVGGGDFRWCS